MAAQQSDVDLTQTFSVVQAGSRFSHYRIESKIGAGGMGDVFLAKDVILDRNVVLKFLSPHLSEDESLSPAFCEKPGRRHRVLPDLSTRILYRIYQDS